jgi:hypothetical protein
MPSLTHSLTLVLAVQSDQHNTWRFSLCFKILIAISLHLLEDLACRLPVCLSPFVLKHLVTVVHSTQPSS